MGRISILLAAGSLLALSNPAFAQEIRQVAPGITMAPGSAKPAKTKKAEPAPVQTSKSEPTTYGSRVSPTPPVEAKIENPQPAQPPVAVKAEEKPDAQAVGRPVAASPSATPQPPVAVTQQQAVTAPQEQVKNPPAQKAAPVSRELKVGDRIPDDVPLYRAPPGRGQADRGAPVRVGDRVPDNVPLYDLPRSAVR